MYLKPLTKFNPMYFYCDLYHSKAIHPFMAGMFLKKNHGVEKHVRISKSCELNGMGFHLQILLPSESMS